MAVSVPVPVPVEVEAPTMIKEVFVPEPVPVTVKGEDVIVEKVRLEFAACSKLGNTYVVSMFV